MKFKKKNERKIKKRSKEGNIKKIKVYKRKT